MTTMTNFGWDFSLWKTCFYFIFHINLYQGNNISNIDIYLSLNKLLTTQKVVTNAIVCSGVANYPCGPMHFLMEN